MRYGLPLIAAVILIGAGFVVYKRMNDPLKDIDSTKLTALDDAGKKTAGEERNKAIQAACDGLKDDYAKSTDKEAFVKALNTRLEKLPSTARVKGDGSTLSTGDDATPATSTPSGGTPTGGVLPKTPGGSGGAATGGHDVQTYLTDLLYYSEAKKGDFEVNLGATLHFTLKDTFLDGTLKSKLKDEAQKAINSPVDQKRTVDDVKKVRFIFSKDNKKLEQAHVYFVGKDKDSKALAPAGKVAMVVLTLNLSEAESLDWLKAEMDSLRVTLGPPDRGGVFVTNTRLVRDRLQIVPE